MINQVSAILLVSADPEQLADFYTRVFQLKFAREDHEDMAEHFGAYLGSLHFAIHPPANFPESPQAGGGGVKIAFETLDFEALVAHLRNEEVPLLYEPVVNGWSKMTAIEDPDGNFVELLQPCNEILSAAATRGRSAGTRAEKFVASGNGFSFGQADG